MLKVLQENNEKIKAIEAKLCTGAPLTPQEQAVYDGNSGVAEEKIAWLQVREIGAIEERSWGYRGILATFSVKIIRTASFTSHTYLHI